MLVDKQNELMSDLLFTVHHNGGDDLTWKPPICLSFVECAYSDLRDIFFFHNFGGLQWIPV